MLHFSEDYEIFSSGDDVDLPVLAEAVIAGYDDEPVILEEGRGAVFAFGTEVPVMKMVQHRVLQHIKDVDAHFGLIEGLDDIQG